MLDKNILLEKNWSYERLEKLTQPEWEELLALGQTHLKYTQTTFIPPNDYSYLSYKTSNYSLFLHCSTIPLTSFTKEKQYSFWYNPFWTDKNKCYLDFNKDLGSLPVDPQLAIKNINFPFLGSHLFDNSNLSVAFENLMSCITVFQLGTLENPKIHPAFYFWLDKKLNTSSFKNHLIDLILNHYKKNYKNNLYYFILIFLKKYQKESFKFSQLELLKNTVFAIDEQKNLNTHRDIFTLSEVKELIL